jgi:hypothetical protein
MKTTQATTQTIDLASPMLRLLNQANVAYQPVAPVALLPEDGNPQASLENVRRLFQFGLTYLTLISGLAGVLFIFQTGEMYLATGFLLGCVNKAKTEALARACTEIGLGDYDELLEFYASLNSHGPVPR